MRALVVEDDAKLARFLVRALSEEGFLADLCSTGDEAIAKAAPGVYDLIVLDWMLPDLDGLSVCRTLRERNVETPILMLTARGETREKVLGLRTGADDYVVKPFEVDELIARCQVLVRRTGAAAKMVIGELELDRVSHTARVAGRPLDLTTREYALLADLMSHVDKVVTKAELLSRNWGMSYDPGSNVVEVHMSRLRDKLGDHAWMIETVRGAGYRLIAQRPSGG